MQPQRKHPRLTGYDYGGNGCYFVTVCTKGKACLFGTVGRVDLGAPLAHSVKLSPFGKIAEACLREIPQHYPGVTLEHFIVMPNHVHLLLTVSDPGAPGSSRPTISQIVGAWKRTVNRSCRRPVFQDLFYDHIIRDERDFLAHWNYIDGNAQKWSDDEYYEVTHEKDPA